MATKKVKNINIIRKNELTKELIEFYSSYYYWQLSGKYDGIDFYFECSNCDEVINKNIDIAISDGKYYFPNNNYVFIGTATKDENCDLVVLYDMDNSDVFFMM